MIQTNVPVGRNVYLDLIRIDDCPKHIGKQDCKLIENYIRLNLIGMSQASDLAVRKYMDGHGDYLVVYVGKCQKREQLTKEFMKNGINFSKYDREVG